MASSEARGPLGMFVGFLLVALGVTLYKPQPKPQPDAPPAKSQTEARNSSGLPMAAVPTAPGAPGANQPTPAQPAAVQPKAGTSASDKPIPPAAAGQSAMATASVPAPAPPSAPTPDEALGPRDQAKVDPAPVAPSPPATIAPTAPAADAPHFDVVRVEPSGDAVVAGKGAPDSKVELLGQGKVIAEARTDAAGNFVILPPTLAPGSYDLSLRQAAPGKAPAESTQSVAVAVPQKGGNVVVALAEPGKPTKVLSAPPAPAPSAPAPASPAPAGTAASDENVAIRSVELENGNGFFASGAAKPGSPVHIYLNGAHIADVVTAPDGQWSVTLKKGLKGGHYVVRADVGGTGGAKVVARVEVPFDVPVAMAEAPAAAPASAAPPAAPPAMPSAAAPSAPSAGSSASSSAASNSKAEAPSAATTAAPQISAQARSGASANMSAEPSAKTGAEPSAPTPGQQANAQTDKPAGSAASADGSAGQGAPVRPQAGAANAIIAEIDTAVVVPGDNLWNISRARLGHGRRFTQIYAANTSQIRDPSLIYPGQVLVVPPH